MEITHSVSNKVIPLEAGYFSTVDDDLNEKAQQRLAKDWPWRFFGVEDHKMPLLCNIERLERFPTSWECKECKGTIKEKDTRYKCIGCNDGCCYCAQCYQKLEKHEHSGTNFFIELSEPWWYFGKEIQDLLKSHGDPKDSLPKTPQNTSTQPKDPNSGRLSCSDIMISCFTHYAPRPFIGSRGSVTDNFSWITFDEIYQKVLSLVKGLSKIGVKMGDSVCIACDIEEAYVLTIFACIYAGLTIIPVQVNMTNKLYVFEVTGARICVCSERYVKEIEKVRDDAKSQLEIVISVDRYGSSARRTGERKERQREEHSHSERVNEVDGVYDFARLMKCGMEALEVPPPAVVSGDMIRSILFTSGTTGFPKGVVLRENGYENEIVAPSSEFPLVLVGYLPLSHSSGLYDLFRAFFNGGRLALMTNSDIKNIFLDFQAVQPTQLISIPRVLISVYSEYSLLCEESHPEEKEVIRQKMSCVFGPNLMEICTGSSHCPDEVKRTLRNLLQIPIYDAYGTTEIGTITVNYRRRQHQQYRLYDVPELGYLGADKPDPRGELAVRKERCKFLEYYKNERVTKEKMDKDWYYMTGDIVKCVGSKIVIIDRKCNVIKLSQGEFVSLEKIEAVFASITWIDQILLFPNLTRTKLFALVQLLEGNNYKHNRKCTTPSPSKEAVMREILHKAKERKLKSYEIPRNILLVNEGFERTELKKKNRRKILQHYDAQLQKLCTTDLVDELIGDVLKMGVGDDDYDDVINEEKSLAELGGDSMKGVRILQMMKMKKKEIRFDDLMNLPIKELKSRQGIIKDIKIIAEEQEEEEESEEKTFVSFENEKKEMLILLKELEKEEEEKGIQSKKQTKHNEEEEEEDQHLGIFLTGASGFIGSHILEQLVEKVKKCRIYCLSRTRKPKELLPLYENVHTIVGDLSRAQFGLSNTEFCNLREKIDLVIHCGAMVNHFVSYKDHYAANTRSLFDIVKIARGCRPIIFISSMSVYTDTEPKFREDITQQKHVPENGYAASKWVSDALVHTCYPNHLILRLSLIGVSSITRRYNKSDWFGKFIHALYTFEIAPTGFDEVGDDRNFRIVSVDDVANLVVGKVVDGLKEKEVNERKSSGEEELEEEHRVLMMKLSNKCIDVTQDNLTLAQLFGFVAQVVKKRKGREMKRIQFGKWIQEMERRCMEEDHPFTPFAVSIRERGEIIPKDDLPIVCKLEGLKKIGLEDIEMYL